MHNNSITWRFFTHLDKYFEEVMCFASLAVVAVSVFLQVSLRIIFANAVAWAEETAILGTIFAVYFGASLAARDRLHIRVTSFVNLFPFAIQTIFIIIADILWFGFVAFLFWQTWQYSMFLFDTTYIMPGLNIEQRWFQIFIPFSLGLLMFRILQVYWRWGRSGWKGLPL